MTEVHRRCRLSSASRPLVLSVVLLALCHADAHRISALRRSQQGPEKTEETAVHHSRRILSSRAEVQGWQGGWCTGDCRDDHSREFDARFKRHLRILFTAGARDRKLGDEPQDVVSSVQVGEGASWARRLVCEPGCLHGGICQLDAKTKEPGCLCPLPDAESGVYFRGSSCQTQAVRCNSTFWCENEGSCQKLDDAPAGEEHYACSCLAGFQVRTECQTSLTLCHSRLSSCEASGLILAPPWLSAESS